MEINADQIIGKGQTLPTAENGEKAVSTFHSADKIINACLSGGIDVDKLERLLEIKGKYEAEEAKKVFQERFAEMQFKIPEIPKTKIVKTQGGALAYKYAPLEEIVKVIRPFLAEYKFSYSWSEGEATKSGYVRVYCHIRGYGHTQTNFVEFPPPDTNKLTNKAQTMGMASTYGRRYSLTEALGLITEDDTDANPQKGVIDNRQPIEKKQPAIDPLLQAQNEILELLSRQGKELGDGKELVLFALEMGIIDREKPVRSLTVQELKKIINYIKAGKNGK